MVAIERWAEVILAFTVRVGAIGAFRAGAIALLLACLAAKTGYGGSCTLPRLGACA